MKKTSNPKPNHFFIAFIVAPFVVILGVAAFFLFAALFLTTPPQPTPESGCCACLDCPECDVCCDCDNPYLNQK